MTHSSAPGMRAIPLPDAERLISAFDNALRTLFAPARSPRTLPGKSLSDEGLNDAERRFSARLMRVNHSGEVSAQALYQGQLVVARGEHVKRLLTRAANEENEHLAWTEHRLTELGGRKSLLRSFWYVGSFAVGMASGLLGDRWNLGFLAETERQVESHLDGHLKILPSTDLRSRAILAQMKEDEAGHAVAAQREGGAELVGPVRFAMQLTSKLMTIGSLWV